MKRMVVVSGQISKKIRSFQLSRELLNRLLTTIHGAEMKTWSRSKQDDRFFIQSFLLTQDGKRHVFILLVDDSSSPEHYIVVDIRHQSLS